MNTFAKSLLIAAVATALVGAASSSAAQSRWQRWRAMHRAQTDRPAQRRVDPSALPAGIRIVRDVHYGPGSRQTFDVYIPADAHDAPVIFMVHGGGWRRGDKVAANVVQNKVAHWAPRGIIVVSIDYPMLPATSPHRQARDVASAMVAAQREAPQWGGDPHAFVLMGHSAGAHLVSLISAEPALATDLGALPWLGTVALDSAAYNVAAIMRARHFKLYDAAFGSDPATWTADSPTLQLRGKIAPFLAVCSSLRADSCPQARAFASKARSYGTRVKVLPEPLRHGQIDAQLGQPSVYTSAVDGFLATLAPSLATRLR